MAKLGDYLKAPGIAPFLMNSGAGLLAASQGGLTGAQRSNLMMQGFQGGSRAMQQAQQFEPQRLAYEQATADAEQKKLASKRLINSMMMGQNGPQAGGLMSPPDPIMQYLSETGNAGPLVAQAFRPPPAPSYEQFKNVPGVGMVDMSAQGGPQTVVEAGQEPTGRQRDIEYAMAGGPGAELMRRVLEKPQAQISFNQNKPLSVAEARAAGVPIGTTPEDMAGQILPKEYSDVQAKSAGYANRMARAEKTLADVTASAGGSPGASLTQRALGAVPGGQFLTSEDYKREKQAREDWVRAKLRLESGAVIGELEMKDEIETYFPKPGDPPSVIEQKRQSRETATQNLIQQSQGAYGQMFPPEGNLPALDQMTREQLEAELGG